MPYIQLRDHSLVYIKNKVYSGFQKEFADCKGISMMDFVFENKAEFLLYLENQIWQHYQLKDSLYNELSYNSLVFTEAQSEIYEWIWAICGIYTNLFMGKKKNNTFFEPAYTDVNLSVTYGEKFYLISVNDLKTKKVISGAFRIEVEKILGIFGKIEDFCIVFSNGITYHIYSSFVHKKTRLATIEVIQDSKMENLVFKNENNEISLLKDDCSILQSEMGFQKLLMILKKEYESDDNILIYEKKNNGFIDIYYIGLAGKHNIMLITPEGKILDADDQIVNRKYSVMNQMVKIIEIP